jgi:hypothetical protein
MQTALANGWASLKSPQLKPSRYDQSLAATIKTRQKRSERGLNMNGSKRKTMRWPELKGLVGKEYHKMYRRLERMMK